MWTISSLSPPTLCPPPFNFLRIRTLSIIPVNCPEVWLKTLPQLTSLQNGLLRLGMRLFSPILVASTLIPLISAVPAGSSITPPPLQPSHFSHSSPRPWTRLRDWIIGSIWDIDHQHCSSKHSSPPSNIHDRYGSDVVLRFHLRQPDEAEALASASQVLFLDIWAITAKFVDIRLADDMVSFSSERFMIFSLIVS